MMGPDPDGFQSKLQLRYPKLMTRHVTWTGWVDAKVKWSALSRAEVFALVSHSENWGAAVVEALLSGTPVLLSDKVNIWREVTAAKAGLVDENSEEGVCRLLTSWILMSDEDKFQYSRNSRECFERNFDHTVAAGKLLEKIQ
jgi:glycosyltransferase involved in cell wall biosynthesis